MGLRLSLDMDGSDRIRKREQRSARVESPFISGVVIVGDGAVWISGGELPTAANKVIGRLDPETNELVATIHVEEEGHGSFATSLFDVAARRGVALGVNPRGVACPYRYRLEQSGREIRRWRHYGGRRRQGAASSIWVTSTRGGRLEPF